MTVTTVILFEASASRTAPAAHAAQKTTEAGSKVAWEQGVHTRIARTVDVSTIVANTQSLQKLSLIYLSDLPINKTTINFIITENHDNNKYVNQRLRLFENKNRTRFSIYNKHAVSTNVSINLKDDRPEFFNQVYKRYVTDCTQFLEDNNRKWERTIEKNCHLPQRWNTHPSQKRMSHTRSGTQRLQKALSRYAQKKPSQQSRKLPIHTTDQIAHVTLKVPNTSIPLSTITWFIRDTNSGTRIT